MSARIFLDYHSTTPTDPEVWEAMRPYFVEHFGNPSSAHQIGRKARIALEDAREQIAHLLHAFPEEVFFTSGATEANNLALFGLVPDQPCHILANPGEHPCVIEPLKELAQQGHLVEWLPVAQDGSIAVDSLIRQTRADTRLISVMLVNHETGAINDVAATWRKQYLAQQADPTSATVPLFHCDAAQAVGKIPVDFRKLDVDALTISAHKFHGPKGIGAVILKRCTRLQPLFFGGHQQKGKRPGTEAVPLAVGMAKALQLAQDRMTISLHKVQSLRDRFLQQLHQQPIHLVINSPANGSPYVVNVSFPGCRAEMLLIKLDLLGIACSTGSACSSGSMLPSPVLQAMQVPAEVLHSAMRFSLDPILTEQQIDEAAQRIGQAVQLMQREEA